MRIQHQISPPLPGRGGNRKRKREIEPEVPVTHPPDPYGYSTFKIEPAHDDDDFRASPVDGGSHAHANRQPQPPVQQLSPEPGTFEYDPEDELPPHLLRQADPATGLINGRSHTQVRYMLMKAKHRWVLEQHEALAEELRVLRHEEKCWKERKDALLDELLRRQFGYAPSCYAGGAVTDHLDNTDNKQSSSRTRLSWRRRTRMCTSQSGKRTRMRNPSEGTSSVASALLVPVCSAFSLRLSYGTH